MTLSAALETSKRQNTYFNLLDELAILRARFIQEGFQVPNFPTPEETYEDWFALGVNYAATFPQSTDSKTFVKIGRRHSKDVVALMEIWQGEDWQRVTILVDEERDQIYEFLDLLMSGQIKYKNCTT